MKKKLDDDVKVIVWAQLSAVQIHGTNESLSENVDNNMLWSNKHCKTSLVSIHQSEAFTYVYIQISYQYVPHKAVAEVSKIANYRRLVAVNDGSQSE